MSENLEQKTLPQLREIAKGLGIKSVTTYKKQQLCDLILERCADVDPAPVREEEPAKKTAARGKRNGAKTGTCGT